MGGGGGDQLLSWPITQVENVAHNHFLRVLAVPQVNMVCQKPSTHCFDLMKCGRRDLSEGVRGEGNS